MSRRPRESTDVLVQQMTAAYPRLDPSELKRPLPPVRALPGAPRMPVPKRKAGFWETIFGRKTNGSST